MYGIDIGIKYDKLYPLAKLVQEVSGIDVPSNRSVVGDQLFQVESGIIANWFRNCGTEYQTELFPFRPEFVGQKSADVVMGKGSGMDSVRLWIEKFQIQADDQQMARILQGVKAFGLEHKRLLTNEEFRTIAKDVMEGAPA